MSLVKWSVLVRAVELGSVTRAAEEFGYTQSGASHLLSALEEETGFALTRRSRAGVRLTSEGEKLLPAVRALLREEEVLRQQIAQINGLTLGTIRVGAFTSVAVNWLPGIIKRFSAEYPGIDFKLLNGDYHDVETWMGEGALDVAFIALPAAGDYPVTPLKEDPILAVLPPDHPLAARASFPIQAIETEPFISFLESSDHDVRRAIADADVRPNVRFTTKDDYAIMAMVENGLGISLMPELVLKGRAEKLRVMPLDPTAHRVIALATGPSPSPAAARFARCAEDWVRENA